MTEYEPEEIYVIGSVYMYITNMDLKSHGYDS